jgi:hypothetical protein
VILWIVLGYLTAALLAFRFWSMPQERKTYLERHRDWRVRYDRGHAYLSSKPSPAVYTIIAIGLALGWPGPAFYRLLWPRGIDYKVEKEKLKAQAKKAAEDAVKEAERIAKEYGLRNPRD